MAEHSNSGRFGTFFGNSEKERLELKPETHTNSMFDALMAEEEFVNSSYQLVSGTLGEIPDVESSDMYEWSAYFFKWTPYAASLTSQRKMTMLSYTFDNSNEYE
jgi:hypothetical protein